MPLMEAAPLIRQLSFASISRRRGVRDKEAESINKDGQIGHRIV